MPIAEAVGVRKGWLQVFQVISQKILPSRQNQNDANTTSNEIVIILPIYKISTKSIKTEKLSTSIKNDGEKML